MRNRTIYNAEAIFVGPTPSSGLMQSSGYSGINNLTQIDRVQSANYSFNVARTDVHQYGQLGRIDAVILTPPTVTLDFSYLLTNINNESGLGFSVNQGVSCISGFLDGTQSDKNYFISIAPDGADNQGFSGTRQVYGFGNGFVSSYSAEAAVGGLPTASIAVEAFNFTAYATGSGESPAINISNGAPVIGSPFYIPVAGTGHANQVTALRPGDISFSLAGVNTIGVDPVDLKIQSFKMSVDLGRDTINALGQLYPKSKPLKVPINSKIDIEAVVGDYAAGTLNNILCNDSEYTLTINLKQPACYPAIGATGVQFQFRGAKLANQNFTSSVGPNKTISLGFTAQCGGPQDLRGIFISGVYNP